MRTQCLFSIGWGIELYHTFNKPYREPKTTEDLHQKMTKINTLPGTIFIKFDQFYKPGSSVLFPNYYTTNKNWDEFYNFYLEEAKRNGWVLKREHTLGENRDLYYQKNDYGLLLAYDINQENHLFLVNIIWQAHKAFNED